MRTGLSLIVGVLAVLVIGADAYAASSSLTDREAPLLAEEQFSGAIKDAHCIVLYYNSGTVERDDGAKDQFNTTPQRQADELMRGMTALAYRIQSTVKFYRVDWKGFKPASIERIRTDTGAAGKLPASPSIVTYVMDRPIAYRFTGTARPDMMPWFIHTVMDYFIHAIKTDKGDYLRGGWSFTDTNASFINLTGVRTEDREFSGRTEHVRVVSYVSRPYDGVACEYERIYGSDGRLLGSVEHYGTYGKVGYFDYDRTGLMQYRVTYGSEGGAR